MNFDFIYLSEGEQRILLDLIDDVIYKYENVIADAEKRGVNYDCSKIYLDTLIKIRERIKS